VLRETTRLDSTTHNTSVGWVLGMYFEFQTMQPMDRYELLLGTVLPRPISIVTTLSGNGDLNAAPYSLFNVVSHDPPVIMIAVLPHPERRLKDTAANIFATREFVVNLVPRSMAEAMNITNIDAPAGVNELVLAELDVMPSKSVKPPRIATSPVAFECRLLASLSFNADQAVLFGEVVTAYASDHLVIDAARGVIDAPSLDLFGAMHAARWYCSTMDRFEMVRPTWKQWTEQGKV
jgi:flavin reductase (DIM6/NTAB) family NADH-FMN oxidoreductase RutF